MGPKRHPRIKRTCQNCGVMFLSMSYLINRGGGKYCSVKCCGVSVGKKNTKIVSLMCGKCGNRFSVNPYRSNTAKYCSLSCHAKAKGDARKVDPNRTNRICVVCGEKFYRQPGQIKLRGGKYCSRKCAYSVQGENTAGEKSPRWRGGLKNSIHNRYLKGAGVRGIPFNLTNKQFLKFWQMPCHYCGSEIEKIGLDRVDNAIGYTLDNVVSCCEICNRMKLALNVDKFLDHVKKVAVRRNIVRSKIGTNCTIWNFTNIYDAQIGNDVKIGSFTEVGGCVIGDGAVIGAQCFLCPGVTIEPGAWVGPGTLFCNDKYPPSRKENWLKTIVAGDARIGARCTILPGVRIDGMVGAGSVVTRDVPPGEVWCGVPARFLRKIEHKEAVCP